MTFVPSIAGLAILSYAEQRRPLLELVVHRPGVSRIRAVTGAPAVSGPSAIVAPLAHRFRKTSAVGLSRLPDWPGVTMNRLRSRSARSKTPRYDDPCTLSNPPNSASWRLIVVVSPDTGALTSVSHPSSGTKRR